MCKKNKNNARLSYNNGESNVLRRMSVNFKKELDNINERREEESFDKLSYPKITELIVKHKNGWPLIKKDIIYYNNKVNESKNEGYDDD